LHNCKNISTKTEESRTIALKEALFRGGPPGVLRNFEVWAMVRNGNRFGGIARLTMIGTAWRILKSLLLVMTALACFLAEAPLYAKPKIAYEIREVARHQMLVTFSWDVTIDSDKSWDGCDLKISFHDGKGNEMYAVKEAISLKVGRNAFNGTEICSVDIWKRVAKYVTTLDCVF